MITLYYCGWDKESAMAGLPYEDLDLAKGYADDNDMNVYSVECYVAWTTMKVVH